jgi:hypothetical protein
MEKGQTTERWGDGTAKEWHKTTKGTEIPESTRAKDLKERETGPKSKEHRGSKPNKSTPQAISRNGPTTGRLLEPRARSLST